MWTPKKAGSASLRVSMYRRRSWLGTSKKNARLKGRAGWKRSKEKPLHHRRAARTERRHGHATSPFGASGEAWLAVQFMFGILQSDCAAVNRAVGERVSADEFESLPPFVSLRAFEAAARLKSFARAAEELDITPGAVSQHVRALEGFARQPGDCAPRKGEAGGAFSPAWAEALDEVANARAALRAWRAGLDAISIDARDRLSRRGLI